MRAILGAVALSLAVPAPAGAQDSPLQSGRDAATVTIGAGGRPVLAYRYGDAPFKPYVRTLCTPAGVQILRDSPADHVHHRGLMFAVAVDGADFWAEGGKSGKQVHASIETAGAQAEQAGISTVRILQKLDWIPAGAEKPVLVEDRLIEAYAGGFGATLLTWRSKLRPAEGVGKVTITGSHYQGLGLRFVQSMDGSEKFLHAAGEPGAVVRGVERVTPSAWSAYTAPVDGKPVTVAVFDHPKNPRSPAGMFTMFKPFSYLSATPNVWKNPLEVKAGETLDLRYGVAVWDGEPGREAIAALHGRWAALAGD